jgi:hypothetical protein
MTDGRADYFGWPGCGPKAAEPASPLFCCFCYGLYPNTHYPTPKELLSSLNRQAVKSHANFPFSILH